MKQWIEEYLADHQTAWSETTIRSESARLRSVAKYLDLTPEQIFRRLTQAGYKAHSIKKIFMRLAALETWASKKKLTDSKAFREFLVKHRNRFKHVYQKEKIELTYEEAFSRLEQLEEPYRSMAIGMLKTGVRISEAYKVHDGQVRGKGEKVRKVYGTIEKTAPKSTFWRKLKAVGLKPHTLRKLWATRLAEHGATPADLCELAGWSSIETAYQYLVPKNDERLKALVEESTKGPERADL